MALTAAWLGLQLAAPSGELALRGPVLACRGASALLLLTMAMAIVVWSLLGGLRALVLQQMPDDSPLALSVGVIGAAALLFHPAWNALVLRHPTALVAWALVSLPVLALVRSSTQGGMARTLVVQPSWWLACASALLVSPAVFGVWLWLSLRLVQQWRRGYVAPRGAWLTASAATLIALVALQGWLLLHHAPGVGRMAHAAWSVVTRGAHIQEILWASVQSYAPVLLVLLMVGVVGLLRQSQTRGIGVGLMCFALPALLWAGAGVISALVWPASFALAWGVWVVVANVKLALGRLFLSAAVGAIAVVTGFWTA